MEPENESLVSPLFAQGYSCWNIDIPTLVDHDGDKKPSEYYST